MIDALKIYLSQFLLWIAQKFLFWSMYVFPYHLLENLSKPKVFVTDVISEPIYVVDMDEEDIPEGVYYDETTVLIQCRVLVDNELSIQNVYTTYEHADNQTKYFQTNIEPVQLNF